MVVNVEVNQAIEALPEILAIRKVVHVNKDSVVFYKGDVTTHVYLIISGEVTVQNPHANGHVYLISNLTAGSFLCDLEILSGNLINATTLAAHTDCTLLRFTAAEFLNALNVDSQFLLFVSKKLAQKMYQESCRLGDNLYSTGIDKLIIYLVKSYRESGAESDLVIRKTRQIIAGEVGVSVKTINRSIKQLVGQGLIEIVNGKILLRRSHYQLLSKRL